MDLKYPDGVSERRSNKYNIEWKTDLKEVTLASFVNQNPI